MSEEKRNEDKQNEEKEKKVYIRPTVQRVEFDFSEVITASQCRWDATAGETYYDW